MYFAGIDHKGFGFTAETKSLLKTSYFDVVESSIVHYDCWVDHAKLHQNFLTVKVKLNLAGEIDPHWPCRERRDKVLGLCRAAHMATWVFKDRIFLSIYFKHFWKLNADYSEKNQLSSFLDYHFFFFNKPVEVYRNYKMNTSTLTVKLKNDFKCVHPQ